MDSVTPTVGVAIPTIPPRSELLKRAVASIHAQTVPVDQIEIAVDEEKLGAGPTRNRAKNAITTDFTCFLDDDDVLYPNHVEVLLAHQEETGADLVFPWFDVEGGSSPFPEFEHMTWEIGVNAPRIFPITVLMKTELAQSLNFDDPIPGVTYAGEDWTYWTTLLERGAVFAYAPVRTWRWSHGAHNTSGRGDRW